MTQSERQFSYWEVTLVVLFSLGNPILYSLGTVLGDDSMPALATLSGSYFISMIVREVTILAMVAVFLKLRGWTLDDLNLSWNWQLTATGIVLAAGSLLLTTMIRHTLDFLGTSPPPTVFHYNPADWDLLPIIAISIVNPVFEETIVSGYITSGLLEAGNPTRAINITVGIRLLYHLYQGVTGVITIVPMGLLFAYCYCHRRKLWPLILAHGVMDFISLISL